MMDISRDTSNDTSRDIALVKSRPIIFTGESVRAILDDRKTQTRRTRGLEEINKFPDWWQVRQKSADEWVFVTDQTCPGVEVVKCPYGKVGDGLWVRETWRYSAIMGISGSETNSEKWSIAYRAGGGKIVPEQARMYGRGFHKWTPSVHMPRWASRIDLVNTNIRVERLQEISTMDCVAEGYNSFGDFATAWDAINGKRYPWDGNWWVFVLEHERIKS